MQILFYLSITSQNKKTNWKELEIEIYSLCVCCLLMMMMIVFSNFSLSYFFRSFFLLYFTWCWWFKVIYNFFCSQNHKIHVSSCNNNNIIYIDKSIDWLIDWFLFSKKKKIFSFTIYFSQKPIIKLSYFNYFNINMFIEWVACCLKPDFVWYNVFNQVKKKQNSKHHHHHHRGINFQNDTFRLHIFHFKIFFPSDYE